MFVSDLTGILMKIEEDPITRYHYELWFDYTRDAINTIAEGAMLAVPNFAGNDRETHYSILEVTGILPMHYALGDDTRGYPGFVVEAARNAGQDWVTQNHVSTEDTTKIRCVAVPTNLEIVEKPFSSRNGGSDIAEEANLPKVGHEAYLLDTITTERIANRSLDLEHENVIQIGALVRDPGVRAFLRVEDFIKVHFGIFGFTGAGKSNLLSTVVRKLLTESSESVKIVIFDLMSEYTGLLLDQLIGLKGGRIINIGTQTVPESVLTYYNQRKEDNLQLNRRNLRQATIDFVNSTVLPKDLKRREPDLYRSVAVLFHGDKVLLLRQQQRTIGDVIEEARKEFNKNMGNCAALVYQFVRRLIQEYGNDVPFEEALRNIEEERRKFEEEFPGKEQGKQKLNLSSTAIQNLDMLSERLQEAASQPQETVPAAAQIGMKEIIDQLNDPDNKALLIFQAHDPDALREFATKLAGIAYDSRRKTGKITPLVSFIFDEADEFIPGQPTSDSQKMTKAAAMTLARRGRKFGLGIGIATQRIRYLDTSILAQPHTYFVSKLPRQSDRQAIAEAFGISEDMFRQTFKFKKGDWLLASYDAAGLEAIPIPIHAEDANKQVLAFVEKQRGTSANAV
jgi:DNA helicase HerA-like ATPase